VAPQWRRKGIGRALIERCLAKLASVGIGKCNIFLFADNELGETFWKQTGWAERSDLKILQKQIGPE
jgi:GNAT superfamily N-acetyltransferase